jgi:tetratricopeptide (TPR) repeat protein
MAAPVDAEAHNMKGNEAFKEARIADAVHHYTNAINTNPAVAKFFSNRSYAYVQLRDSPQLAIADAERAVSLSPSTEKFHYRLITALNGGECFAALELYCARFLKLIPNSEFAEGCESLAEEAQKRDKARKLGDKQKYPVGEPPSEAPPLVPEHFMWYGYDKTAYQWWACFDGCTVYSDRFVDAHRFVVDAFALGCGETKEQPFTAPQLYAFALQAWRFGQLPCWFNMDVLVLLSSDRLGRAPRSKEVIRTAWRETPYHSPHLLSAMRYLRDTVTLTPNTAIAPETVIAASPDCDPFASRIPAEALNGVVDYTALHHTHQWRDRALPVLREFERRYISASNNNDVRAAIELTIALLSAVLPASRADLSLASMLVFVHWRSAEHALYWFSVCMRNDDVYRLGMWSRFLSSWVLLLGAHGWTYNKSTSSAFVALIWNLFGASEHASLTAALAGFAGAIKEARSSHEARGILKHVFARPEGYAVTAAAAGDALETIK